MKTFILLPFVSFIPFVFAYWKPMGRLTWNIGYEQPPNILRDISVYNIDMEDVSINYINKVHQNGGKVICYFSAGTFENWRSDAYNFPKIIKGNNLNDWAGEKWLNIRHPILRDIMTQRIQTGYQKGCDAIDPDNVDGYQNPTGFNLTYYDQYIYNKFLMDTAHLYNMSVSLKNNLDQIKDLILYADFAVNEQCVKYNECDKLKPFLEMNKTIFHIEYNGSKNKICKQSKKYNMSTIITNLFLNGESIFC